MIRLRKDLLLVLGIYIVGWLFLYFLQTINYSTDRTLEWNKNLQKIKIDMQKTSISYTTVVSIYFELNNSKHSKDEYRNWLTTMLKSVENAPLVIFTDKKSIDFILKMRKNKSSSTEIIIYESVWDVLMELGEKRGMNYADNYLNLQNSLDPEKSIHNSFLYAIWNLKSYFVQKVIEANPFGSKFFIYTDAGAWRNNIIAKWPDNQFIQDLNGKLADRVLFGQMYPSYDLNNYTSFSSIIQGTFFAGSSKSIDNFFDEFWRVHDKLLRKNEFIGKDQTIMKIIAFETFNQSVVRLKNWEPKCNGFYDPWFFYQLYFSQNYLCSNERFSLLIF